MGSWNRGFIVRAAQKDTLDLKMAVILAVVFNYGVVRDTWSVVWRT